MPLLNGRLVDIKDIDPGKHRFIGMFRPAELHREELGKIYKCRCGVTLQETIYPGSSLFAHWQQGHMDEPQYIDIEK